MGSTPSKAARRWLAATTVLLAVFAAHAAYPFGPTWFDDFVARWVNAAVCLAPGLVLVVYPPGRDAARRAWRLMGAALTLWGVGNTYFLVVFWDADTIPIPSPADGFWFAFYLLSYLAILLLMRVRLHDFRGSLWLDGVIAATALAAIATAIVFGVVADAVGGNTLAVATNLSYPLMDVLLGAMVIIALSAFGWNPGRAWALIALGYGAFAVADSIYLYQSALGTYVPGNLPDVGWPLAMLLVAYASVQAAPARPARLGGWLILVVPATSALLSVAVLLYDHFERVTLLAVVLASVSIATVVGRLALTFAENLAMLAQSRVEAATDALTGLANRRRLLVDLDEACAGSGDIMLALFDLDGFKTYNDEFGHVAGDTLLVRLGRRFAAVVEPRGTAYRLGGDEFCALLRTPAGRAEAVAKDLARMFDDEGDGFSVSASFGSVMLPREARTASDALRLADQRMYRQKRRVTRLAGQEATDALTRALSERSAALGTHVDEVASLALDVARRLGRAGVDEDELRRVARLHDVGKIAIPDAILDKPGDLDSVEWQFIRQHTLIGERIIGAAPALAGVAPIVRSTHENFDGTGYPDGLAGEDIPLTARIVFACDAFHAMTSDRPYAPTRTEEDALAELRRCAGTQFDPVVVEALETVVEARRRLRLAS